MAYVTGAEILAHVGEGPAPSADKVAWAAKVAAAIEAAIAYRLASLAAIDAGLEAELERAALQDGAAGYLERGAPHGVMTVGQDGETVRLGRDNLRALEPIFGRYAGPGIG